MPTLQWIGKAAVVRHHKDVPFRLFENEPALGAGERDSSNLIVEGDNLDALKALLPRYAGQVKCIYIDPPYNTGNEGWIYNDNVNSPEIRRWLGEVVGKEGETLDRHDRWLCMMYPRLFLLKQFLRADGVIFVSIDDHEIHHLRSLMDEIFGVKKRLESFVWRTDGNFDNQAKIKNCHEYVLAYAMDPDGFPFPKVVDPSVSSGSKLNRPFIQNTIVKNGPKNPVSSVELPVGFPASVQTADLDARSVGWPRYASPFRIREGVLVDSVIAESGWSSKDILLDFISRGFQPVKDSKGQSTRFVLTKNGAIESIKEREQASHVISVIGGVGSTQSQSAELQEMGFSFPFPKPVELVKYLISMIDDKDALIMDSFAGSGTTGEAVLRLNAQDGGTRKFILIEENQVTARTITAARLGKAICGYSTLKGNVVDALGDGFKFCKLSMRPMFGADGSIRSDVTYQELGEYVWFMATGAGVGVRPPHLGESPFLGEHRGRHIFLLYNGILKDRTDVGGNVLNSRSLEILLEKFPERPERLVIYGARTRFDRARLAQLGIEFHMIPYELMVKSWT